MTTPDTAQEAARLAALQELDLLDGERLPQLDRVIALAAEICGANIASFTVHDATRAIQVSTSFGERETMPREACICSVAVLGNRLAQVDDARADPRMAMLRHVAGPPHVRSYVGAPVGADGSHPVGVLSIGHTEAGRFGAAEVARLRLVADLVNSFLTERRAKILASRAASKTDAERKRQIQFDMIFDAIREGVNVYSPDGRIVESNKAAREFLQLTLDQQIGRAFTDPALAIFRADGAPLAPEDFPIADTLRTGAAVQDFGIRADLPSGARHWLSINTAPIRNAETGAIEFGVATFRDVTRERVAEDEVSARNASLAEALAAEEKANRAKSDFLGVMSHELRTPMNAVLGCARLISETPLDATQRRTLGVLQDAGRQMLALLNDLFDMTSLDAHKVRIEREPVSLVRLIEDAAVIWASEVQAKGLSLSVMIDPALVAPRSVDPARLLQIIGNLMANAIKFTASGGVTIQAWPATGRPDESHVDIEVSDTGPGVPREAAERIFSAFEQVDVSAKRRHGGLGLGLHVARSLAIAMGGDVALESQLGEGSRFTVRIEAPRVHAAPVEWSDTQETDALLTARDVLCVDDNPRNLYVLGAMLRAAGHRTTECSSGADALMRLGAQKFDVVLLDMVIPGVDGLDVLARLRAVDGPNRTTPVIACTANVMPHQIESYHAAGTAGVLAKPIDVRAMLDAVASAH